MVQTLLPRERTPPLEAYVAEGQERILEELRDLRRMTQAGGGSVVRSPSEKSPSPMTKTISNQSPVNHTYSGHSGGTPRSTSSRRGGSSSH